MNTKLKKIAVSSSIAVLTAMSFSGLAPVNIGLSSANSSVSASTINIPSSGTYTFTETTNVRTAPNLSAQIVASYDKGQSVKYTSTVKSAGYLWIVYTGASGATRYAAVDKVDSGGGTVTPSTAKTGWPFAKAYTGHYEDGQQFGHTSYNRGGSPDAYFHDGFDFGSAIYGAGSTIKAVTSGKVIYTGIYGYGLGAVIVVQAPDGKQIMYQEFSQSTSDIHVSTGSNVTVGQNIGRLSGSHVHIGVTTSNWQTSLGYAFNPKGPWINPITYIQSGLK